MTDRTGPRVAALVPAAGTGSRLGLGPKAFVALPGGSLLATAVAGLQLPGAVDEVVVAVPPGREAEAARELTGARVIAGGASRQATVAALLDATEAEIVAVHDAARPFLPGDALARVVAAAVAAGAATLALPVADTLFDTVRQRTVDRGPLRAVQTPQAFRRTLLVEAHARAERLGLRATDDASLVRDAGHPVALVAGSPWLFKVTTPADLALARALAPAWNAVPDRPA